MIHKCSITYIDCYKHVHVHLCTHMNMHAGIHLFMHTCNLHILSKRTLLAASGLVIYGFIIINFIMSVTR